MKNQDIDRILRLRKDLTNSETLLALVLIKDFSKSHSKSKLLNVKRFSEKISFSPNTIIKTLRKLAKMSIFKINVELREGFLVEFNSKFFQTL